MFSEDFLLPFLLFKYTELLQPFPCLCGLIQLALPFACLPVLIQYRQEIFIQKLWWVEPFLGRLAFLLVVLSRVLQLLLCLWQAFLRWGLDSLMQVLLIWNRECFAGVLSNVVGSSIRDWAAISVVRWLSEGGGGVEHFLFDGDSLSTGGWFDMTGLWSWACASLEPLFHKGTFSSFWHRLLVVLVLRKVFLLVLQIKRQPLTIQLTRLPPLLRSLSMDDWFVLRCISSATVKSVFIMSVLARALGPNVYYSVRSPETCPFPAYFSPNWSWKLIPGLDPAAVCSISCLGSS